MAVPSAGAWRLSARAANARRAQGAFSGERTRGTDQAQVQAQRPPLRGDGYAALDVLDIFKLVVGLFAGGNLLAFFVNQTPKQHIVMQREIRKILLRMRRHAGGKA